MNKYIISFDKSNEDIPTLIVAYESSLIYPFDPDIDIVKIITGDKAVRIFEELTKKVESKEVEDESNH